MLLVKNNGEQVIQFPYTLDELFHDNPCVYFPDLTNETLARFNAAHVVVTGAPPYDPITQEPEQIGCNYNLITQRWETAWIVRQLTQAEVSEKITALMQNVVNQTQERLDVFARTRGYDGILSGCTYASSTVQKFKAEGQYCVNARDATWEALYQVMDGVKAGARPMPSSYEDIEADLPALEWPA